MNGEYKYGPLEVINNEHRQLAKEGLFLLWKATDLHYPGTLRVDKLTDDQRDIYEVLLDTLGWLLLGQDKPEFEQLT